MADEPLLLYILRHGKSDWDAPYEHDHERPLAKRGKRAADTIGRFLTTIGGQPERILTSTAERALRTVRLAAEAGRWTGVVIPDKRLYGASAEGVLKVLREQAGVNQVLIAGHEPTQSELITLLTRGCEVRFPTAALACLRLNPTRWADAAPGCAQLDWLVTPKLLRKLGLR